MSQLPALTGKEVAVALGKAGFSVIRSRSIHHFMRHPDSRTTVAPCCVRVNSWWAANDEFSGKVHGLGETNGEKEVPDSTSLKVVVARPGKRNCRWIPEIPHSLSQLRTITRPHGLVALIEKESPERSVLCRSQRTRRQRAGGQESLPARSRTSQGGGRQCSNPRGTGARRPRAGFAA